MLQTRSAKRTAAAAIKIATDMVKEGLITKDEAIKRVEPAQVEQLLLPRFDQKEVESARAAGRYLAKGLNASPGAATGRAVFDADRAVVLKGQKQLVVLVRPETSPDDFHGMVAATGILTARGGSTSHAAVVARGLGLPCVAGVAALDIDLQKREMRVDGKVIKEGEAISIDGTTGEVFAGELPTIAANFREEEELIELLSWADKKRKLGVWVNADTPGECRLARELGAEGVGLARTEHMFREAERLPIVQDMILANDTAGRKRALAKLLPFQQGDFREMYEAMDGLPVVIRLIDPPLHEFLREYADVDIEIARACIIADQIATKTEFFSFGTNDLTQTVLGISRDDAQKSFLTRYVEEKIIPADPFQVLDRDGVGAMMRMAVERGRKTKPGLKIGICGEHAGEPSSVALCHELGLTYVSPSTYRVPVARLAAAQAALAGGAARDR